MAVTKELALKEEIAELQKRLAKKENELEITRRHNARMAGDVRFLASLRAQGVDQWDGYFEAITAMTKEDIAKST